MKLSLEKRKYISDGLNDIIISLKKLSRKGDEFLSLDELNEISKILSYAMDRANKGILGYDKIIRYERNKNIDKILK